MTAFWRHPVVLCMIVLVVMTILMRFHTNAPDQPSGNIPAQDFSGERAFVQLSSLLLENHPHPAGSPYNKLIRQRIENRLAALGYTSEIQRAFKCTLLAAGCAFVENVIAVLPGRKRGGKAVLLTAHYDSAPAAPGAGDDGAGVAAMLEIAANLKAAAPLDNDVIFLFSDAEEAGLLGAATFRDSSPLMDRVGIVLNMEARGVSGPSVMFETGPGNLQQVRTFAESVANPVSSSLMVEIYKRMPNGTDYMVYGQRGLPGLNFAFTDGVSLYHSVLDDPAHLDKRSLHHQGENLLSVVRAFGMTDLDSVPDTRNTVHFDLYGAKIIYWPAPITPLIVLLCLCALTIAMWRIGGLGAGAVMRGSATVLAMLLALPAAGWLASFPLGHMGNLHNLDHPYPWPGRIALILLAVLAGIGGGFLAARRCNTTALFLAVWGFFGIAALALSLTVPAASYMFVVPLALATAGAGICSVIDRKKACAVGACLGLLAATYMALYHFVLTEVVFNFQNSAAKTIPLLLLTLPLMVVAAHWREQAVPGRRIAISGLIAALAIALITAALVPGYTAERPRSVNIIYRGDVSENRYRWQIHSLSKDDPAQLAAAGFPKERTGFLDHGFKSASGFLKDAPDLGLPAPVFTLSSDRLVKGRRVIEGTLTSPRGGFMMGLGFPDNNPVVSLKLAGQPVLDGSKKPITRNTVARIIGAGSGPVTVEIIARPGVAFTARIFDLELLGDRQPEVRRLQALRPPDSKPVHYGDHSILSRTIRFEDTHNDL